MSNDPTNDSELAQLMDGLCDADEAGDKAGYIDSLTPAKRDKLLGYLTREIEKNLRGPLH